MSTKILITTLCIAMIPLYAMAQQSKFSIAVQTTTIEPPIPFGGFKNYETAQGYRGHYSIEILGRFFLNNNLALRLRTGITNYRLDDPFSFFGSNLKGQFQKHAIGIESRRILGDHLAFRLGFEAQIGFFKDMIDEQIGDFGSSPKKFDMNTLLSLNPLMGADWFLWRGLSLSAELRLPFERIRYADKGVFINSGTATFDNGTYNYVGFGKPICSFQMAYQF